MVTPHIILSSFSYTLIFLNLGKDGLSAAEWVWGPPKQSRVMVLWRDGASGQRNGPDSVIHGN